MKYEQIIGLACLGLIFLISFGMAYYSPQEEQEKLIDKVWWESTWEKMNVLECEKVMVYYSNSCSFEETIDIINYCGGLVVCEELTQSIQKTN